MDQIYHNLNEDTPQFLKDLKNKDTGYRLPSDYFAQMQSNVLSQVAEKESVGNKDFLNNLKSWYQFLFKSNYGYASLAAITLMVVFVATRDYSTGLCNSFTLLEDVDLEYFIENEIDDVNDQELMATIYTDQYNINNVSLPISSSDVFSTIAEEFIEDFDNLILEDFILED